VTEAENEIAGYLAEREPRIAVLAKALRARMRARLLGLVEVVYVYERQGSLVISYSPTGRGYEAPCGIAIHPDHAQLFFGQGSKLSAADPARLLQGRGKTVRHVVVHTLADFDRPEVEALLAAALELGGVRLDAKANAPPVSRAASQRARAVRAAGAGAGRAPTRPTRGRSRRR
jgi:hypothetical protein